jgi:hypothetical protein
VTPHYGRIENQTQEFYQQFHVIILGLDSLEARRYMNSLVCGMLGMPCCLQRCVDFVSWVSLLLFTHILSCTLHTPEPLGRLQSGCLSVSHSPGRFSKQCVHCVRDGSRTASILCT